MAKKNTGLTQAQKVGLGVGLTAAAAAAAGAFFLYGSKNAAKNRTVVKSWILKAKAEVLETLEKATEMTQKEYETLIDSVAGAYSQLQNVSRVDVSSFKKEMKEHWNGIVKSVAPKKKVAAKKTPAAPKKAAPKKAVEKK